MTAQNDLDRTLSAWFGAEAAPAVPPEPLARSIETTRARRRGLPWWPASAATGSMLRSSVAAP